MTEIDNDKLLRDFFTENRQEIADRGFSRTFRLLRRTGSCMGNDSGGIHRHD